jgi:hypothetical protein
MYRTQRALSPLEQRELTTPIMTNQSVDFNGSSNKQASPYSGQKYREAIDQFRRKIEGLSASVTLSPKAFRDPSPEMSAT